MIREIHNSREEWLDARNKVKGIGASEAGLICGCEGAFGDIDELYNNKKDIEKAKEVSNSVVMGGVIAEPLVRDLFALANKDEYSIEYHGYDIFRSEEHPFMFCTLDGELTRESDKAKGIYEGKFVTIRRLKDLEKWNGKIPDYYLCQQIHQLVVCNEFQFNILVACLVLVNWEKQDGKYVRVPYNTLEYRFSYIDKNDDDFKANADWLVSKETEYWENQEKGIRPVKKIIF